MCGKQIPAEDLSAGYNDDTTSIGNCSPSNISETSTETSTRNQIFSPNEKIGNLKANLSPVGNIYNNKLNNIYKDIFDIQIKYQLSKNSINEIIKSINHNFKFERKYNSIDSIIKKFESNSPNYVKLYYCKSH